MADKEALYCPDWIARPFNREEAALNVPSPRVALVAQMAATLAVAEVGGRGSIFRTPVDLVEAARAILAEAERQEGQ